MLHSQHGETRGDPHFEAAVRELRETRQKRFGDWSMFRFLTEHAGLDERTVDLIGTVENLTSRLPLSFVHSFIGSSLISPDTAFWELEGGTAVLPDALLAKVRDTVRFDRRVTRIEYYDPDLQRNVKDILTISGNCYSVPLQRLGFEEVFCRVK